MSISDKYKWPDFESPFRQHFGTGVDPNPKSKVELKMIQLSATIRRKPFWFEQIHNRTNLYKWREEAKANGFNDKQVSYVFQELSYYATRRDQVTGIEPSDLDEVWHSDSLIDGTLRKELMEGVEVLEDISEVEQDWHPGSKNQHQVWNLVDPSLYPIVYGKTQEFSAAKSLPEAVNCRVGQIIQEFHDDGCYDYAPRRDSELIDSEDEEVERMKENEINDSSDDIGSSYKVSLLLAENILDIEPKRGEASGDCEEDNIDSVTLLDKQVYSHDEKEVSVDELSTDDGEVDDSTEESDSQSSDSSSGEGNSKTDLENEIQLLLADNKQDPEPVPGSSEEAVGRPQETQLKQQVNSTNKKELHAVQNSNTIVNEESEAKSETGTETNESQSEDESVGEEEQDSQSDRDYAISNKFCWLPTDFIINSAGTVKISSYINNLHPDRHKPLYRTLEKIFSKFVPLFDKVLLDQCPRRPRRVRVPRFWCLGNDDKTYDYDPEDKDCRNVIEFGEASNLYSTFLSEIHQDLVEGPDPPKVFVPPKPIEAAERLSLLGKTVQVIVKLVNIVLTPEKPKYEGDVWHVEGMKNERIVAIGNYYYDMHNITQSEIAFRQSVGQPEFYEQEHSDDEAEDRGTSRIHDVYGAEIEDGLNQKLGSVLTKQDRCLAFPNILQQKVLPFKLIDPTKPGHQKILVFFLVNPGKPVVSTTTVPPQQLDWYIDEILKIPLFKKLPIEIIMHIMSFLNYPISWKKAKKRRRLMIQEREYFVARNTEHFFERSFTTPVFYTCY